VVDGFRNPNQAMTAIIAILSEKYEWFSIDELPNLIYDHNDIIKKALSYIRIQLNYLPVSLNLLPHKFTMLQLQKLYEGIFEEKTSAQ